MTKNVDVDYFFSNQFADIICYKFFYDRNKVLLTNNETGKGISISSEHTKTKFFITLYGVFL